MIRSASLQTPQYGLLGVICAILGIISSISGVAFTMTSHSPSQPANTLLAIAAAGLGVFALGAWLVRYQVQSKRENATMQAGKRVLKSNKVTSHPSVPPYNVRQASPRRKSISEKPDISRPPPRQEPPKSEADAKQSATIDALKADPFYQLSVPGPGSSLRCFMHPKVADTATVDDISWLEYEDSYAFDTQHQRFAVTDGVSNNDWVRPWAGLVAQRFVDNPAIFLTEQLFISALHEWGALWRHWVEYTWWNMDNPQVPIDDVLRKKMMQGAQATFVGCTLHHHDNARIEVQVFALGDAEFFHFERKADQTWSLKSAFPLTDPSQFSSNAATLGTDPAAAHTSWQSMQRTSCIAQQGDILVLTSDALGQWLLKQSITDSQLMVSLVTNTDPGRFAWTVLREQQRHAMTVDDVTMLVVSL